MAIWHLKSKRKPTGGKINRSRKKKKSERGSEFLETKIKKRGVKVKRSKGGNIKFKIMSEERVNVADPKTGKIQQAKIISVKENSANPHYVRRNVITKGAVIETDLGLARVTSRPGQNGVINAVLIGEKK
jgi:small subunit ribosomal protein S8e